MLSLTRIVILCIALLCATAAPAQERFSFFQASTPESVERMLKLANLRDDYINNRRPRLEYVISNTARNLVWIYASNGKSN